MADECLPILALIGIGGSAWLIVMGLAGNLVSLIAGIICLLISLGVLFTD